MNTLTQLPALDDYKAVSPTEIEAFRKNGHVLIPAVLNQEEVTAYRGVIASAAARYNEEKRKMEDRDTYGKAFLQIMNLWVVDEDVKKFTLAKRFAKIAADLLGVDNVRIYHDQALFKEPGGGPTPWHQDQYYWPIDTHNTVTLWMPMVDIDVDMGMLTFASGSHTKGYVFDTAISDESETAFDNFVKDNQYNIVRPNHMNAGDATFHYGFTIHNAPGNNSDMMREVMTIIYVADGARITEPKHQYQIADHAKWLKGLPVGSEVSSELNPLVL
ncbi:phytanoyl-CoA dioxygenase family protein [Foetidibacter luteolus]|uniref:phytanoyl-CoA dioxygenase family protein n=1 Tax=Foetidibacter luteolus TaxID=2608880 RepID=UPI00129AC70E|nr:phytanoyl-CoA dioxygenase family protein [Foetidibacter luteolus]